MPVNMGTDEGGSGFEGLTGNFRAKAIEVAEKLVEGKEDRPAAVRVMFQVEDKDDKLSLFVPLHESAADRLRPFIPNAANVPTGEKALRSYLATNMPSDTFLVYASNSSIRGVTAAPGKKHRIRLVGLNQFSRRSDGQRRVRFFTETKDHETVTWTVRYPNLVTKVGQRPEEDDIGPAKEFNPNPYMFAYAIAFGLDWTRFTEEVMGAYEDGQLFSRLGLDGEIPGYFHDKDDITEEVFQAAHRHNPNRWCEVMVVDDQQYGIGPKRGEWSKIELTPVIVEGSGPAVDAEFQREVQMFLELWDNLTKVVLKKDEARFMAGGHFTPDGVAIVKGILKPLVLAYPDAVLVKDAEGKPGIPNETPSAESWALDGLVCANFTAERLMAADQSGALFDLVNLSNPEKLLAWATENVPEWATIGQESEGEVL